MAEFLSPGHYKSESPPQVMTLAGVSVSTGAIVGVFEKGPIGAPRLVTSLTEFQKVFGGYTPDSYAPYAVEGAFRNKPGMRLYIVRTAHYTDPTNPATCTAKKAAVVLKDRNTVNPADTLKVEAINEGTWGEKIAIEITDATKDPPNKFRIVVKYDGVVKEVFDELSMDDNSADYVESKINGTSEYIRVTDMDTLTAPPNDRPAVGTFTLAGGDDGIAGIGDNDYLGSAAGGTGLHALDSVEDALLIAVPGIVTSAVHNGVLEYCASRMDSFAILDPPMAASYQDVKEYVETTAQLNSEYGAIYWPNVGVSDPLTGVYKIIPPSGHAMGAYARVDAAPGKGPWKVAAGIEDGQLYGVLGVEDNSVNNKAVRDVLYPARINPIRAMSRYGRVLYGARTLSGTGKMTYINERRTFIYVEKTVDDGTQWVEFENNDPKLWARLTRTISAFLLRVWRAGGLRGETPEEAFIVKIDAETNPEPGPILYGKIGLATHTPAEFVWFDYMKHTLEAQATQAPAA
ncbi:MAG TPA: phage tail sheath family protein [Firmicutes bacterium]|nr:phage tail sheath family protein [Bacillota bacterium]